MEIMESDKPAKEETVASEPEKKEDKKPEEKDEGVFSEKNIAGQSVVSDFGNEKEEVVITPEDKKAFIDAVVSNVRFTKEYVVFGGRMKARLRSLTSDEVNALASWTAKKGAADASGLMAGRYRKYLLAAYIESLDGVEMPPMEEPLYETLGSDGKTVNPPGWVDRCKFFDSMDYGKFQVLVSLVRKFDNLYSAMCKKASDENFWLPDTP